MTPSRPRPAFSLLSAVIGAGLIWTGAAIASGGHHHGSSAPTEVTAAKVLKKNIGVSALAEQWGIELVSLRTIAGGHMLDLRYRVVDQDKAQAVLRSGSPVDIMLRDRITGYVAEVPMSMLGKLRVKAPRSQPDRIYFVLFDNPGKIIKSGKTVEVHFGDIAVGGWPVL